MREIEFCFRHMSMYIYFREGVGLLLRDCFPKEHTMVEIATNEAINNAFKHGAQCSLNPHIQVKIGILDGDRLFIRIIDSGNGFKHKMLWDEQLRDGKEQIMRESGRGLLIMNHVFDEIHYNSSGNEVTMIKRLDKSEDNQDV